MQLKVHHMKKIIVFTLPFFISMHCYQLHASADLQQVDHSVNLTSTYRTTSGTEIIFDLDQCSRLGSIAAFMAFGGLGLALENKKDKATIPFLSVIVSALLFKAGVNITMALKEFKRHEIARGIEHLSCHIPISPIHLYILLTRQTINDRLLFYRIINFAKGSIVCTCDPLDYACSILFTYGIVEPFLFIKNSAYGHTPIRWSSCN